MTRCGIVLLPEPGYVPPMAIFSKEMNALADSHVALDEEHTLADITVAHLPCSRDEAETLWAEVKHSARPTYELNTQSVYLSPRL